MLKSISDLKTLFEVMALVIVKSTSTLPAFYVMFYSCRACIHLYRTNKKKKPATQSNSKIKNKTNSSRETTLNYYKGNALKAVNAYVLFIRGLVNDK